MQKVLNLIFQKKLIYTFGFMFLFFMLFDGIITYLIPLTILEHGFSKTLIGVIISSAAIAGAFFDIVIYKIFKKTLYRRLFIVMFIICFFYVFLIWNANSFWMFIAAMAMWGFYFDLKSFGTLDFISKYSKKEELSSNFGILQIFQSIGYILAPLIAGFVIIDKVGSKPFILALIFLSIAVLFFIGIIIESRNKKQFIPDKKTSNKNTLREIKAWKETGALILPILLLTLFLSIFDSFFITLGPIVAENLPIEPFDGTFMFAYFLPALILGSFVGNIAKKFRERKSIFFCLLIGSLILSTMFIFRNYSVILVVFASSCFICIVAPISQSIYAKYIHKYPKTNKEIQGLSDFFSNCGYIIGPIMAGIIADNFGNTSAFSILGFSGAVFAVIFFIFAKKVIN